MFLVVWGVFYVRSLYIQIPYYYYYYVHHDNDDILLIQWGYYYPEGGYEKLLGQIVVHDDDHDHEKDYDGGNYFVQNDMELCRQANQSTPSSCFIFDMGEYHYDNSTAGYYSNFTYMYNVFQNKFGEEMK